MAFDTLPLATLWYSLITEDCSPPDANNCSRLLSDPPDM